MVSYVQAPEATAASPPPSPRVAFEETVVTGVSRPMTNTEHWSLYNFEMHARDCRSCQDSRRVQRHGKSLCDEGHKLAFDITNYLYSTRAGVTFSTATEAGNAVRVEIPESFLEAKDLLRAIERSVRHKDRFVSKARLMRVNTEPRRVIERVPSVKRTKDYHRDEKLNRSHSVKKTKENHSTESKYHTSEKRSVRRSPEVVEWPSDERDRLQRRATVTSTPNVANTKTHRYPVVINDSRTGVIAERQLHERPVNTTSTTPRPTDSRTAEVIIEKAAATRGSLYLSDKAELEKRELRERKMAYNLEVREPSSSPPRERRKVYRANGDRYWR